MALKRCLDAINANGAGRFTLLLFNIAMEKGKFIDRVLMIYRLKIMIYLHLPQK